LFLKDMFPGFFYQSSGPCVTFYFSGDDLIIGESSIDNPEPPSVDFAVGVRSVLDHALASEDPD
jgi:hypothetical protein